MNSYQLTFLISPTRSNFKIPNPFPSLLLFFFPQIENPTSTSTDQPSHLRCTVLDDSTSRLQFHDASVVVVLYFSSLRFFCNFRMYNPWPTRLGGPNYYNSQTWLQPMRDILDAWGRFTSIYSYMRFK
ncbi:hypothetical protein ES288_D02G239400v1 [Gossypium darwinii]|uniref:Uncharacterized protein n=1 Tax=Gossypium darwinii TaxID=34276 RepID=A0A5D2DGC6_GOSDA|nr:hypothetical protein ES288_D02G239400v1 [Gossypium darwinii]